jgi:large subunit ribosomal protein L15
MGRKKAVKMRGSKTHGYGSKKKHRGGGSRGGKGFAGSFKHKKVFLKKYHPDHFRKKKFKSLANKGLKSRLKPVNLRDIQEGKELKGCKVLAGGSPPSGEVRASAFSRRAKEKIEKAGGKAVKV